MPPPPPPWKNRQWQYQSPNDHIPSPRQKSFWRSSYTGFQPPYRQLGVDILAGLRSMRGGIYYVKSNLFKQVHYVDHSPVYICELVPSYLIPSGEWKVLNTEVDKGLIRGEALDLLGYSYTETDMGKFSISGDLELVRDRLLRSGFDSAADNCLNRVESKSSSTFHTRRFIGIW